MATDDSSTRAAQKMDAAQVRIARATDIVRRGREAAQRADALLRDSHALNVRCMLRLQRNERNDRPP